MKKLFIFLVLMLSMGLASNAFAVSASGDPVLVPGDDQITTVGAIAAGSWAADVIPMAYGGSAKNFSQASPRCFSPGTDII